MSDTQWRRREDGPTAATTRAETCNRLIMTIFALARDGEWDGLIRYVEDMEDASSFLLQEREPNFSETILHVVCHNASVTPQVIESILTKAGSGITLKQNWLGQTPLHVACAFGTKSTVVRLLVASNPRTTRVQDNESIRPLDIIIQKIIMKEERAKYSKPDQEIVQDLWESCRALIQVNEQPMVHSCLLLGNTECPIALWDRVLKRFTADLQTQNEPHGNLPLHIAASIPPLQVEDEEEETDHLVELIDLYPQAASERNNARQLPLELAISAGRSWNTGILALLEANPGALESLEMEPVLYPVILSRLAGTPKSASVLHRVLLAKPDLFVHVNSATNRTI